MSLTALLVATKSHLLGRENFPLQASEIEILPGPQPPPRMGTRFLSIYGSDWSPGPDSDQHRGLCEQYSIGLTLTFRVAALPYEATANAAYITAGVAMEPILRQIIIAIHQNVSLITLANTLIPENNKIQTYLRWRGCGSKPTLQGPNWFWSSAEQSNPPPPVGFSMEVTFGGALRYQDYDSMG